MLSRRSFGKTLGALAAFCAFPIALAKATFSTKETWLPKPQYYARIGERVTCENGHHICNFVRNVHLAQQQDLPNDLGNWQQPEPKVGQIPLPVCAKCGSLFVVSAGVFHIESSWRDPLEVLANEKILIRSKPEVLL